VKTESRIRFDWQVYDYSDKTTIRMRFRALPAAYRLPVTDILAASICPARPRSEPVSSSLRRAQKNWN